MKNNSFMSDTECAELRKYFINSGYIVPSKTGFIKKKSAITAPTTSYCQATRQRLIEKGIITSSVISTTIPKPAEDFPSAEEGVFTVRPIGSDEEYERRWSAYMEMLREVLVSRRDLKLDLGLKKDTDPDWYF